MWEDIESVAFFRVNFAKILYMSIVIDSFRRRIGLQDKDKTKKHLVDEVAGGLFARQFTVLF